MKLVRFDHSGTPRLGVVHYEEIVMLDPATFPSMLALIEGGPVMLERVRATLHDARTMIPLQGARLLAPIERPGKYLAIGMNYRKHVEEAERLGVPPPTQQYWFNKQTSCLAGSFDVIEPGVTRELDYEVELGVVIGTRAKSVLVEDAAQHVFGYVVANDVSARDWQRHTPTFTMGKSFDTHGPIGPWIVTSDEIEDPHRLALRCFVNGEQRQSNHTSQMIFNVWEQIAYLSTAFTLDPGDLIATGTPEGVGAAMTPPTFLKEGDVVRCEVEGIGAIENVVAAPPSS